MALKSRRQHPPSNFVFFEPRTGWQSPNGLDFDTTVNQIIQHRLANPRFAAQWSTEIDTVKDELDHYTCQRLGNDPNWCDSGGPPSFPQGLSWQTRRTVPSRQEGAKAAGSADKVVAGIGVLRDWLGGEIKPVEHELAEKRAAICATCSKNDKATTFEKFFTLPAAELIKKQIAIKHDMKLSTSHDKELGICNACGCALALKTHVKLDYILAHTSEMVREALDERCWILHQDK